ncbi:MAG TPA: DUF924 family protein [Xanthobacteraceae bacterium]|nr:DUF924 family protein [Xanthobacteraceae bacterium]
MKTPHDVLTFWRDAGPERWYEKDAAFDADMERQFLATWELASKGELSTWEDTDEGTLALLIVLDQFSRNLFRGDVRAFQNDPMAREIANRAIARGVDQRIDAALREFIYMPFEHSEDLTDQKRSVALFRATENGDNLKWAILHLEIIEKFGRFPHRNKVLGRVSSPEEEAYLADGGFSG